MAAVLLLQMPFGSLNRPNLGLSLLQGVIEQAGHTCRLTYANIPFARRIGLETYEVICRNLPPECLFGEYLFASAAFDREIDYLDRLQNLDAHINTSTGGYTALPDWLRKDAGRLEAQAQGFLQELADTVDWTAYDLVGLSTTFQQTTACLALARRIKEQFPSTRIILGGANCEADMGVELHHRFPQVDFVCLGEGERLIASLLERMDAGAESFNGIAGLAWRDRNGETVVNGLRPEPVEKMDDLPTPDFHGWADELKQAGFGSIPQALPWQTSRGCWYGAREHCIFCGLNGQGLRFRSKSPDRALAELRALMAYDTKSVYSVDCVLDHRYFRSLLPQMAEIDHGLMLFFETRPTLTRPQVRLLQAAGILWIQPGIESLNTRSLRRMQKGVTAAQNILLLKYAAECGVGVLWNILYGFAGETAAEFLEMAAMAPLISHLQAPSIGCHRVRLDRFSPMQTNPDLFGLANVRPYPTYGFVFPFEEEALSRMAYYFTYDYRDHVVPEEAVAALKSAIASWQNAAGEAALLYIDRDDGVNIYDTRGCAAEARQRLEGVERLVFLACDCGATRRSLQENPALQGSDWERSVSDLVSKKLVVELDDKFINIAVRMSPEDLDDSSANASDEDRLMSYLERMRLMRYQIDRLKVRSAE